MKQEKKMSKKASAKIWNVASKFKTNLSKNTSYDEAWEIIAEAGDLECSIYTNKLNHTKFTLYRGDEVISEYDLNNVFEEGDYDWTVIYKTVLDDIVARRLYKKQKISKRSQKKKDEVPTKQIKECKPKIKEETEKSNGDIEQPQSKEELKRLKFNLKMKIKNWSNKGKDVSELRNELDILENKLKSSGKSTEKPILSSHIQEISNKVTKVSQKEKKSLKSKENKSNKKLNKHG